MYQRLIVAAVLATYLLIVVGAVVRVTGSGLGCPDWPRCHGGFLPPLETAAILEYSHRLIAAIDSVLIFLVVLSTWTRRRRERGLLAAATAVPLLLAGQIGLGAVTVVLELPPAVVLVHLLTAMAILGTLVWMAVAAGARGGQAAGAVMGPGPVATGRDGRIVPAPNPDPAPVSPGLLRTAAVTVTAAFILLAAGSTVRATGATWACSGFPGCNGLALPFGTDPSIDLHLAHRLLAYGFLVLLAVFLGRAWRARGQVGGLAPAVAGTAGAAVAQLLIGAAVVSTGAPAALRGAHVAGAAAVWAGVVLVTSLLLQASTGYATARGERVEPPLSGWRAVAGAYLSLTKPGIIVLLLVTTVASMMVAAKGLPPPLLVLATLAGGALAAGAANTFNCYLDRDIDALMTRTARRPLVSGLIRPAHALAYGLVLALLSVVVLAGFVNWLAAVLSLCGLLYYVFVYTCWLKRSSPSNIVIGGAAGAVPPLVGWAAVTGEVSLLAVYLFAVIFFWTPPHFWALALLIRREYEKAHVPMLPTVRGEKETRQQIVVYTVVLVVLTLAVVLFREVGVFYVTAAALLGGVFVYHALRLLQEATPRAARGMFRYSILYLALLFFALVVDQWGGS